MKEVASSSSYSEYYDLSFDAVKDIDKNLPEGIRGEYFSANSKQRLFESSKILNSYSINYNSLKQRMDFLSTLKYIDLDRPVEDDNFLPIFPFKQNRMPDNKSTNCVDSFTETQPQYVLQNTVSGANTFKTSMMLDSSPINNDSRKKTTDLNSFKNSEDLDMPSIEDNHFTYKCMSDRKSTQGVDFFAKTQPQHAPLKPVPDAKTSERSPQSQSTATTQKLFTKQVKRRNADGIRKCSRYMVPSSASGKKDIIRLPERKCHLQTNLSSDSDLFVDPVRCIPRTLSLPNELKIIPPCEQDEDNSPDRTTKKKCQIPKLKDIPIIPELVILPKIKSESEMNNVKNIILEHGRHFHSSFVLGTREPSVVRLKDRLREDWLQKFVPPRPRRRRRKSAPNLLSTVNIPHLPPRSDQLKTPTKNLAHTSLTKSDSYESLRSRIQRNKNKGNIIKKNITNLGMVSRKPKNAKKNLSSLVTQDFDATSTKTDETLKIRIVQDNLIKRKGDIIKNLDMVSKRPKNPTENLPPLVKDCEKRPVKIDECPGTLKRRIELDKLINTKDNIMKKKRINPDKVMRKSKNAMASSSSVTNDFDTSPVKPDDFSHIPHDDLTKTKGNMMKEEIANAGIISSRTINSTDNFPSILTEDCDTCPVTGDECPVTQKYGVGHHKLINSKGNDIVEKTIANPCMVSEKPKNATENLPSSISKDSYISPVKTCHIEQDNLVKDKGDVIVEYETNPGIVSGRIRNATGKLLLPGINNSNKRSAKPVGCPVTLKCSIELAKLTKSIDDIIEKKIANPDMLSTRCKNATDNLPSLVTNDDTSPAIAVEHPVTLKCHIKHHKLINFNGDNINQNEIVSPGMVSNNPENPTEYFPSSITKDFHTSPTKTDECPVALKLCIEYDKSKTTGDITDKEIANPVMPRWRPRNDAEYLPSFATKDCNTSPTQSDEVPVTLEGRVVNDKSIKNKGDIIEENMVNRKIKNELEDRSCLLTKNSITSSAKTEGCLVIPKCHIAHDEVIKSTENCIENEIANPDMGSRRLKDTTEYRLSPVIKYCDVNPAKMVELHVTSKHGIAYDKFTNNIRDVIEKKLMKPDTTILRSQNITESVLSSVVKYCDQIPAKIYDSPVTLECPIEHNKLIKNKEDLMENEIANLSIVSGRTENAAEHVSSSVAKDFDKKPVKTEEFPAPLKLCIEYDQFTKNIRDINKKNIAKSGMVCKKHNATENLPCSVIKYDDKSLAKNDECPVTLERHIDQANLIKNEIVVIEKEKVNPDTVNGNLKFMASSSASGLKNIISLPETQSHETDLLSSPELFVDPVRFIPRDLSLPNELKIVPLRERRSSDSNCFKALADTKKRDQYPKLKVSPILPETMNPQVPSPKSETIKKDLIQEEKLKLRNSTQLSQRSTSSPITIKELPNKTSEITDTIQCHSAYDKLIKNMGEEVANRDKVGGRSSNAIENSSAVVTNNFDIIPAKTNVCPVTLECSLALDNLIKNEGDTIDSEITKPGMVSEILNIGTENHPSLVTKDFVIRMSNRKKATPPLILPSRQVQHVIVSIPITKHMRIPKPQPNIRILEQIIIKPEDSKSSNQEVSMTCVTASSNNSMTENVSITLFGNSLLKIKSPETMRALDFSKVMKHLQESNCKVIIEPVTIKKQNNQEMSARSALAMAQILDFSKKSTFFIPTSIADQETIKLTPAREYNEDIASKSEMVGIIDLSKKSTLIVSTSIADQEHIKPIAARKYNEDIATKSEIIEMLDLSKKSNIIFPISVVDQETIKLMTAREYNENIATKWEMVGILDLSKKSTLTVPTFIADEETVKPIATRKYNEDNATRSEMAVILDLSKKSTLIVPSSVADQESIKLMAAREYNKDFATKSEMVGILDLSKKSTLIVPTSVADQETIKLMAAREYNEEFDTKSEMTGILDLSKKSTLTVPTSIADQETVKPAAARKCNEDIATKCEMPRILNLSKISSNIPTSIAVQETIKPMAARKWNDNIAQKSEMARFLDYSTKSTLNIPSSISDSLNKEQVSTISTKTAMFRYLDYSRNKIVDISKTKLISNAQKLSVKPVDNSAKSFDSLIIQNFAKLKIATKDFTKKSVIDSPEEKSDVYIAEQVIVKPEESKSSNQEISMTSVTSSSIHSSMTGNLSETVCGNSLQKITTPAMMQALDFANVVKHIENSKCEVIIKPVTAKKRNQEISKKSDKTMARFSSVPIFITDQVTGIKPVAVTKCDQEISTKTAMFRYLDYSRNTSKEMFVSNAEQIIFKPVDAKRNEDISLKKFDSTIIKSMDTKTYHKIATQDLANKSVIPEEKSDVYIADQVLIKPVDAKKYQEIATKDFANKSVIPEEKSDVYITEKVIIKPVDSKKCQEMSTIDLFNKVIQTHSPMADLEVSTAETVKTEQQELSMKSSISISEIESDISENVINGLDVVNEDWSVTPWEQPRSAVIMSMSSDYECKGAVEFINFTDSTGSTEKKNWQKEIQEIIQNITMDAEEFSNDLSSIPLPEVAPPACEISVDEIPLPEESPAPNDQKVPQLCSVEDVPRIDQVTSQQRLPTIFDYKPDAPVIAASSLPSGTPILRVDDSLLPLSLCDEYLVLTDVDIPCNSPTYFTLAPYNNVSKVIMDTLNADHEVSDNNNSGTQISDEKHDNNIAVNCNNHVRDNSIDDIDQNLYDKDTKESAEVLGNYNNNKENDNDLHIDSDNIVVIAKNDNYSTVNNNNTQEYDNNIGIRDCNEEEEENKTDDEIVNEGVPSGDKIVNGEVKSVDEFVNEEEASRDEFGNGGATSINEFVNEGITFNGDAYTDNVVLSVVSSAASLRQLAASGALLLVFAASSGVTSLLRRLWLRGRLVLCGNVPGDALRDLASQLNASCSSQPAPDFKREE